MHSKFKIGITFREGEEGTLAQMVLCFIFLFYFIFLVLCFKKEIPEANLEKDNIY